MRAHVPALYGVRRLLRRPSHPRSRSGAGHRAARRSIDEPGTGNPGRLAGLQHLLKRTRIGLSIRAVSNNALGARYVGIDSDRTIVMTFVFGSLTGAVAGALDGHY
ncbi:MAG: hypothetical protein ABWZ78_10735 [Burkholderiaceae bacterium]